MLHRILDYIDEILCTKMSVTTVFHPCKTFSLDMQLITAQQSKTSVVIPRAKQERDHLLKKPKFWRGTSKGYEELEGEKVYILKPCIKRP